MDARIIEVEADSLEEARGLAARQLGVGAEELTVDILRKGRGATLFARKETWLIRASRPEAASDDVAPVADAVNSVDGSASISYSEEGVFLTVQPPMGAGRPVSERTVLAMVERRQVSAVDRTALRQALDSALGTPALIAPKQKEFTADGKVDVRVSADSMSATLAVYEPVGGRPVTFEQAMEALRASGVKAGIDEQLVRQTVEIVTDGVAVTVARGSAAVEGKNASIEYMFALDPTHNNRPTELSDGRVDYHNINQIQNVSKGTVLAVKRPAEPGVDGINVRGDRTGARSGRDIQIPIGKGCEVLADGVTVVAAIDGQVTISSGKKITVLQMHEVKGDVDLNTGNIDFIGNVVIRGSLASGFSIKAEGDVTIEGYVDAGTIHAGGNVTVRKGVQGRNKGVIEAGGSVAAMFVENGIIHAGGNVTIAEAIMHSEVSSGGSITCGGRKGLIVGGRLQARDEVSAKVIGAGLGTLTEVEVGVDPAIRDELSKVASELRDAETNLTRTSQAVKLLKEMEQSEGQLDPDRKDKLLKLIRSQYQLMGMRDTLANRRRELEEDVEGRLRGRIRASDTIYSGARVTIGRSVMLVRDDLKHSSLLLGPERTIVVGPYE